ncbi:6453_t:CDS:1, partial [Dentiscutata erythropus]
NADICERLSDLGVISDAFLSTPELTADIDSPSSSSDNNGGGENSLPDNDVKEPPDEQSSSSISSKEKKSKSSPITEMLYTKWLDQLRIKWPIGFGSGS